MSLQDLAHSTKVAAGTVFAVMGSYFGFVYDLIPDDISKLAALLGIPLTIVLTYYHGRIVVNDRRGAAIAKQAEDLKRERAEWEREKKRNKRLDRERAKILVSHLAPSTRDE